MLESNNNYVSKYLKMISEDNKLAILDFYYNVLNRDYNKLNYYNIQDNIFSNSLSDDELIYFREYSSHNYRNINKLLRGTWNYEDNGNIENQARYKESIDKLRYLIDKEHSSVGNIKTYRGVDIKYFKEYGVNSLEDLKSLENTFILDKAFVSTSLLEEKSFFKKEVNNNLNLNIQIEYLIPEEFKDGIVLSDSNSSHKSDECEYLINTSNLAKISKVTINDNNDTALVQAVMIPKEIYDDYYKNKEELRENKI